MKILLYMSTKIRSNLFIGLFFGLLILGSCKKSAYTELVTEELDKNIVNDSLLFGLKLRAPKQDFFDTCWQLNKDKIIRQGPKLSLIHI